MADGGTNRTGAAYIIRGMIKLPTTDRLGSPIGGRRSRLHGHASRFRQLCRGTDSWSALAGLVIGWVVAFADVFGVGSLGTRAVGADWPLSRGDAQSTGATAERLPANLEIRWEFSAEEPIDATPLIVDGRVYLADVNGMLYCLDLKSGQELWRLETGIGFASSPAVDRDLLVIGDLDGKVYAVDVASGQLRWEREVGGEIGSDAAFFEDNVLIASQDGNLYGLARADGSGLWKYETSDQIQCNPSLADDRTFLGGCDGNLHAVSVRDGTAAADPVPLGGPTGSTPAITGNRAILPIMDGAVVAIDWKSGRELWRYVDEERSQEYRTSPAVKDQVVVVTSQNRHVDALDLETGKRKWRYTLRRRADASPVISADDVWIASTDGRLTRLSLADGSEKWQFEIRGQFTSSPGIAQGRLVIADSRGIVRCFASPEDN